MQEAFDKMLALMTANVIASYPDHNIMFYIYTEVSDFQLAFKTTTNYNVMKKGMLCIVATLEEF
ncbi:hypothetical protein ACHAW6_003838 [Cyclotella cf. meneghiniana]